MTEQTPAPTSDEGLMAAIAHFFGLLVAFIVWITQKDKSRFVRFQAIQAIAFDLVVSGFMFIVVCYSLVLVLGLLALGIGDIALFGSTNNPMAEPFKMILALMSAIPFLIPCIILPVMSIIFITRLIATTQTFQGKDFRYPWLGNLIERYQDNKTETV